MAAKTITVDFSEKNIFRTILAHMREEMEYSPDAPHLNAKEWYTPLFVYGPEKKEFSEHQFMQHMPRVGIGRTNETHFVMETYKYNPVVFCEPTNVAQGAIQGEVFCVPPSVLYSMDKSLHNGLFTRRSQRWIRWFDPQQKDDKEKSVKVSRCWMYTAFAPEWQSRRADMGMNVSFTEKSSGVKYYQYTSGMDAIRKAM